MILSDDQKREILDLFNDGVTNLNEITQTVFDNDKIDGRSKEGRAVKQFLIDRGHQYNTTSTAASEEITLTPEQVQFLRTSERIIGITPLDVARIVFDNEDIQSLSSHHRVVLEFLKEHRPDILDSVDTPPEFAWTNPKSLRTTMRRINKWTSADLGDDPDQLSSRNRKNVETLMKYMASYKLSTHLNAYTMQGDRDLFESEFIRATWDKTDLTTDDLNLYMTVCLNYVRSKHIQARISSLNKLLQEQQEMSTGGADLTISLTERIKSTNDELNQTEKRVESIIQRLNIDRSKRKGSALESNGNFLVFVEEFQRKESRDRIVKMAELENEAIKDEARRLESVDALRARIFGISVDELV